MFLKSFLLGCAAACACGPLAAAPVSLALRPSVSLDHSRVVLADLAEVQASPALQASLAALEIGRAPRVGYVERITRAQLEALIRRRLGDATADVDWRGAAQVELRTASRVIGSAELARAATAQLRDLLAANQPGLIVAVANPPAEVEVPVGAYEVRLRPSPAGALAPRIAAWLDILVDGQTYRSVVVPLNLTLERDAYVARRALGAGAVAVRADFELRRENVAGLDALPPSGAADSWRLRQPIEAGQVLRASHVPAAGGVLRGDHVRLLMRDGPIGIETDAIALAAAAPGEMLGVSTTTSKEALRGRLGPARTVVIE